MHRPSSAPPALPGYQFVRLLGSGGFSDVFLYDQAFPKRRVAVKVLLLDDLTQAARDAFTAEANVMAQLSAHPYIVTIFHAAVSDDDRPYLVMEYYSGESLDEQYKRQPLSVAQALEVGVRLSSAIATAHAAGILHRDIKPANVLTNQYGWPALTDFGISSAVDDQMLQLTTTMRAQAGPASTGGGTASVGMSIPWSPPEIFDDDPQPDKRSDVFSLAATLYTVLEGHTPFEVPGRSNGSSDVVGRIVRGAVTPMSRVDVPPSLTAVLRKGMAGDPDDRFSSAVEFGRALQRVEVELSYAQTPLDLPNLAIERPEHGATDIESAADETRARVIPVLRAQAAPAASVAPAPTPVTGETVVRRPQAVPERTVVRRGEEVDSATVLRPKASVEAPSAGRSRKRAILWSVVGAVIVIAGIGTTIAISTAAPKPAVHAGVNTIGDGPAVDQSGVPDPGRLTSKLAQGGATVRFTWVDPSPKSDDSYAWAAVVDGAPGNAVPVSTPTASVRYTRGMPSCVKVWIVRGGQLSTKPLTGCYPK